MLQQTTMRALAPLAALFAEAASMRNSVTVPPNEPLVMVGLANGGNPYVFSLLPKACCDCHPPLADRRCCVFTAASRRPRRRSTTRPSCSAGASML